VKEEFKVGDQVYWKTPMKVLSILMAQNEYGYGPFTVVSVAHSDTNWNLMMVTVRTNNKDLTLREDLLSKEVNLPSAG
jgi:hypothetical protein